MSIRVRRGCCAPTVITDADGAPQALKAADGPFVAHSKRFKRSCHDPIHAAGAARYWVPPPCGNYVIAGLSIRTGWQNPPSPLLPLLRENHEREVHAAQLTGQSLNF